MKIIYFVCSIVISISCSNSTQNKAKQESKIHQDENSTSTESQNPDSSTWEKNFQEFVNAILEDDREKVKSFFDFPIRSKGNEIWWIADTRFVMEMDQKNIVPFTEDDFDKYYSSIFLIDFRKTLEKLSLGEFFLKEKASSPKMEIVKDSKSILHATFEKTKQKLTLNLSTTINVKGQSNTEFSIYYEFDILKDQKLRFKDVKTNM